MTAAPAETASSPVLDIEGYGLRFATDHTSSPALDDIRLSIARGEVLGLVGESGSGKTSLAYAVLRHLPTGAREHGGAIRLGGVDLRGLSHRAMRDVRGARIGLVFQDPNASLNPTLTLGEQMTEGLRRHRHLRAPAARELAEHWLHRVGIADPAAMLRRYPHEASGGEKQRVVIATAFAPGPALLLLDEPTTALDVITARQILDLFAELQAETGVAALYISHDLALVARVAARVAVLHRGRIVETGAASQVFAAPRDAITRDLVAAVPRPGVRLVDDAPGTEPVLGVAGLGIRYGRVTAVQDVSFDIRAGEIVGLVGESGSGKSSIARALAGLSTFDGQVMQGGRLVRGPAGMDAAYRRAVQMVFQNPDASLNPRHTVGQILARPLALFGTADGLSRPDAVAALLASVQLPAAYAVRYPHRLSGGEKQRVAIARAFAAWPALVICDEVTSALDVSVQARIIQLLLDLRARHGTATLFITHDLNLVRQIAHRIGVMQRGRLVELSTAAELGQHPYTRALLDAVPAPPSQP